MLLPFNEYDVSDSIDFLNLGYNMNFIDAC